MTRIHEVFESYRKINLRFHFHQLNKIIFKVRFTNNFTFLGSLRPINTAHVIFRHKWLFKEWSRILISDLIRNFN